MSESELVDYLSKYFQYHPDGKLTRTDRKNSNGSYDKDGYLIIKIKGMQHKSHRLVWAIHNGKLPLGELDHINRVRDDNRIENLRKATRQENIDNAAKEINKDTGVVGVHYDRVTKGLLSKHTVKLGGSTYRFRTLKEAVKKRGEFYDKSNRKQTKLLPKIK